MVALALLPASVDAQYFGRNKVQYDRFDFRWIATEHFQIYFYPAESLVTADAARMAERWYVRHHALFGIDFAKNPLIFYADAPDFQQSNVIESTISQGTGGVTEGLRDRVIMPFTGSYAETDHVLGHELVHVFQYRDAQRRSDGLNALNNVPLWVIEGMAEYLSLGRHDANTAMWMRDAVARQDLPSVDALSRGGRYFPYRYGQALLAHVAGTWGDEAVIRLYRAALAEGWDAALQSTLGIGADSLSRHWHAAARAQWGTLVAERSPPARVGRPIALATRVGDQHVSPVISPDGRHIAFFSSRELLGIDLYVAETATGRVVKRLTSVTTDAHYDALSFINTAGAWSPDSRRFAFVVFAGGNHRLQVVDVATRAVDRTIRVPAVSAMSDPAWSSDGRHLAFVGMSGGIADLWLYDFSTGTSRRLTNDREAQLHPAWSPDGRWLAFATDGGDGSDFPRLSPGAMRLALLEVTTGNVRFLPRFGGGKQITPQFAPDGRQVYYVSDRDGVSDIYRLSLETGTVHRVTRLTTGVSGIAGSSPALSVSSATGALAFSVFARQGYSIRVLEASEVLGTPVVATTDRSVASLVVTGLAEGPVENGLRDIVGGLPNVAPTETRPYEPRLSLDYVSGLSLGVAVGGGYGTGLAGGIAFSFSDMLGNRVLQTVVQAQGEVQDLGAQVLYLNRERRWNWGGQAYHIPYTSAFAQYSRGSIVINGQTVPATIYTQQVQRVFYDQGQAIAQYPLSSTRRIEVSGGLQHIGFSGKVDSVYVVGNTVVRQVRRNLPSGDGLTFGTGSVALVGDNSFFGFTSPIAGGRYRFEVTPYSGSLTFGTLLADARHYAFARPFTIAARALHYGRYGGDAESSRLGTLFVGQNYLIRGYEPGSFDVSECVAAPGAADDCPQYTRLAGSRLAVANLELRIPLVGSEQFGLVNAPIPPIEVAPFLDMGAAWTKASTVRWAFDRDATDRVPVFSAGVSARVNLFGFAVAEIYWARPFQRPGKGWVTGIAVQPGW
jgi:hypothetical protein